MCRGKGEAENPIVKYGKSEEESNMAIPSPVGKNIHQDQNVGEVEVSDVFGNTSNKGVDRAMVCATYW